MSTTKTRENNNNNNNNNNRSQNHANNIPERSLGVSTLVMLLHTLERPLLWLALDVDGLGVWDWGRPLGCVFGESTGVALSCSKKSTKSNMALKL